MSHYFLLAFLNLIFICYHSKFDYNVLFVLGAQDVFLAHKYTYLFIFGSISHVAYDTTLSSLLLVFRRCLVLIYFTCVGVAVSRNMLIYPILKPFHLVNHTFVDRIFDCLALWKIFIGISFQVHTTPLSDITGYVSFTFWVTSSCDYH